jgi:hypothetical protein
MKVTSLCVRRTWKIFSRPRFAPVSHAARSAMLSHSSYALPKRPLFQRSSMWR